jgi:hypothetical protein
MVKSSKAQRLREKVQAEVTLSKQSTLANLPQPRKQEPSKTTEPEKQKSVEITEIAVSTTENELSLKVAFKLYPSRTAFSTVNSHLFFNDQKIDSLRLRILQGPLAADESEFSSKLDMTGIAAGRYAIRVEMFEFLASNEKVLFTSKQAEIDYVPIRREDRLVRIPTVKSVAGADLAIATEGQRDFYREMDEAMKKERASERDYW